MPAADRHGPPAAPVVPPSDRRCARPRVSRRRAGPASRTGRRRAGSARSTPGWSRSAGRPRGRRATPGRPVRGGRRGRSWPAHSSRPASSTDRWARCPAMSCRQCRAPGDTARTAAAPYTRCGAGPSPMVGPAPRECDKGTAPQLLPRRVAARAGFLTHPGGKRTAAGPRGERAADRAVRAPACDERSCPFEFSALFEFRAPFELRRRRRPPARSCPPRCARPGRRRRRPGRHAGPSNARLSDRARTAVRVSAYPPCSFRPSSQTLRCPRCSPDSTSSSARLR